MCNSYLKIKTYCFLMFAACCILSASPAVAQTYFNDFEGVVGPEWSNTSTDITPAGARTFLGQFCNQTVSLTLASVPAGDVTVSFDLFIINTWDGHGAEIEDPSWGPDVWDLSVGGGPTLLNTTFATHEPRRQAYPDTYPGGLGLLPLHPHNTGAAEVYTLGYGLDAVYNLSFTFAHAGGPLVLDFSATGLQGLGDESWGLDNVLVNCLIDIDIDIKPGSDPNPINQGSNGLVPVAILSSPEFDATQVDPTSVSLAGASVAVRGKGKSMAHEEDVNGDGLVDLVVQVETQGFDELGAGGIVELTGTTFGGEDIVGYDEVIIVTKAVITGVVRDGVTEGQPEIVAGPSPGGLQEGSHAFMDRPLDEYDTRNYHWEGIPAELVGADYVMTYNEDKQPWYDPKVYNVSYAVTLGKAAKLYIFVDDRYAPFAWLTDGSAGAVFADTGLDIMLNEVGGREVLQPYDVYGAEVSAGTYVLGPSCDGSGDRSFYSIAAAKL